MFILNKNLANIEDLITKHNLIMCHGSNGCGKSSIAEQLCKNNSESLLIDLQFTGIDFMSISIALNKPISKPTQNLNYFIEYLSKTEKKLIVFDNVLSCDENSFRTLINLIKSSRYFSSTTVIGFYNDLELLTHYEHEQFEKIFNEFEKYKVSTESEIFTEVCNFLKEKTHKIIAPNILKQFLEAAQYNLHTVIQAVNLYDPKTPEDAHKDFDATRIRLLSENIKNRLSAFKERDKNIIQKTSAIGFQFNTEFIEACFNIAQIDAILLGIMNYDQQLYKKIKENTFSFFNQDTRNCIYGLLTEEQRINLNMQIADYCVKKSYEFIDIIEKINFINLAYVHLKETNDKKSIYTTGCKLLKLYEIIDDSAHIVELCRELPDFGDKDERYFILTYFAYALSTLDKFKEANATIDKIKKHDSSLCRASTLLYFDLNYIKNLYLSSAEPNAHNKILKLEKISKKCGDNVFLTQLYSLLTSIYDNIGEYTKSVKSEKQAYFYANKCRNRLYLNQLYLKSQINKIGSIVANNLKEAKKYFTKTRDYDLLAQANHNYGTEMIFVNELKLAQKPLLSAYIYYKNKGSVWSVYPLNNLAVLDILNHKYDLAIKKLSKPFPCGTELFSFITVLCNKLVCYLKIGAIATAEKIYNDILDKMLLAKDESDSCYLKFYVNLMKGLIFYHKGDSEKAENVFIKINIPEKFLFMNEFIRGFIAKIHGSEIHYGFPYIEQFIKEEVYLCDFLFIE